MSENLRAWTKKPWAIPTTKDVFRDAIDELARLAAADNEVLGKRLAAVEKVAHAPFDFACLIARIEALEARLPPLPAAPSPLKVGDEVECGGEWFGVIVDGPAPPDMVLVDWHKAPTRSAPGKAHAWVSVLRRTKAPSPPAEAELVTRLAAAERLLREAESSVAFRGDARLQSEIESFLSSAPVPDPLAAVTDAEADIAWKTYYPGEFPAPFNNMRAALNAVLSARRGGR